MNETHVVTKNYANRALATNHERVAFLGLRCYPYHQIISKQKPRALSRMRGFFSFCHHTTNEAIAMLTKRQRDLMLFLQDTFDETGIIPTYEEMLPATGLKSKGGIKRVLYAIQARGFINILPRRPRAIDIIRRVERTPAEMAALEAQKSEAAL